MTDQTIKLEPTPPADVSPRPRFVLAAGAGVLYVNGGASGKKGSSEACAASRDDIAARVGARQGRGRGHGDRQRARAHAGADLHRAGRPAAHARGFQGQDRAAQPLGHMVRALPQRDGGARPAAEGGRLRQVRGGDDQYRHLAARAAQGLPRRDRREEPRLLRRSQGGDLLPAEADADRRSACRRPSSSTARAVRSA